MQCVNTGTRAIYSCYHYYPMYTTPSTSTEISTSSSPLVSHRPAESGNTQRVYIPEAF